MTSRLFLASALTLCLALPAFAAPPATSTEQALAAERARLQAARAELAAQAAAAPEAPASTAAAPAPAAPTVITTRPAQPPAQIIGTAPPTSAGGVFQTILALAFVLALLGGMAWFMKRFGPKNIGGSAHLRVVGSLNLGGRERLMVVEVGNQWIVVGASPGRVNALATMPKQEGVEGSALLAAHQPPASSFGDWLKQTIDKRNAQ